MNKSETLAFSPRIAKRAALSRQRGDDLHTPRNDKRREIALRLSKNNGVNGADPGRSLLQVLTTVPPFVALLAGMVVAFVHGYWLFVILLAPLAAGLLVRMFIFQHDCGHGSFFRFRSTNDYFGRFLSLFTLTPYDHWRRSHAVHHATSGNLDKRGTGDVPTITVREYQALRPLNRMGYRLFRNPLVMIFLGAPINFILLQRFPLGRGFRDHTSRRSITGLDIGLALAFGLPMLLVGVVPVLAVYLPVMIVAAWIGGWLFYVQHQFDGTYWVRNEDWNHFDASIIGSSYLALPRILQWFTGNIGLHHIHHLNCRIPNYKLQSCIDGDPELTEGVRRITLCDSFKGFHLALWDEQKGRLVSFKKIDDIKARGRRNSLTNL